MRNAQRPALPSSQVYWIYLTLSGLVLTGAAWLYLHYFGKTRGEFGDAPHPLEPWCLRLHGALAIAANIVLGSLIARHMLPGWRARRHLKSGASLAVAMAWLVISGYALYYTGSDDLRAAFSVSHWTLGFALAVLLPIHLRQNRWRKRSRVS